MRIFGYICLVLILFTAGSFVKAAVRSLKRPFAPAEEREEKQRFAILIAARNEEKVIGRLLESLQKQNYPKDRYNVFVLVNHSNDHTAEISIQKGAQVIQCPDTVKGKGDVLKFAFSTLKKQNYDGYIIFDADNLVHEDFLRRMNNTAGQGCMVIQGRRLGKNTFHTWLSQCYGVFYLYQNIYYNHARSVINHSASINGTAWYVSQKYLDTYGFEPVTMTEDLEMDAVCALQGVRIGYCHEALSYDEFPEDVKTCRHQLKRWIFGQVQCMRVYAWKLLLGALKGSRECAEMFFCLIGPLFIPFIIFWLIIGETFRKIVLHYGIFILLGVIVILIFGSAIAVHAVRVPLKKMRKGILCFPIFLALWLPYMVTCLFMHSCDWTPIAHDDAVGLEEVNDEHS